MFEVAAAQLFTREDFKPIVPRKRRSPHNRNEATTAAYSNPEFAGFEDNNGRVTTKEVRQLIGSLKEIITHQTTVIERTKAEILDIERQNAL
ncbi:reverse transcriptase [Penicillium malachiteum]|nr:reverse transcriptase [Penicillium malachiteum]